MAVDSTLRSLAALDMAAALAAECQAHLETLFIEDVNLLTLAELPFASELDRTSGELRRVDPTNMASALQAQARRVQQALKSASDSRGVQCSLRVVRGHYIREVTSLSGADVLFMSTSPRLAVTHRFRLSAPGRTAQARRAAPVCVYCNGSAAAERAVALAGELAVLLDTALVVLRTDREPTVAVDRVRELTRAVRAVQFETVTDPEQAIRMQLKSTGCMLLVMPRHTLDTVFMEGSVLADATDCPLVLVT